MKWKNRLTNYNFWISIVSAVLLILQAFEINFDIAYINEIATAVLGLLVVIGIISDPTKSTTNATTNESTQSSNVTSAVATNESVEQSTTIIKENETPTIEEQIIPINAENANNNADIQNDFKVLIEQIQHDIEEMTTSLNNLKQANVQASTEEGNETIIEQDNTTLEEILPETTQTSYNIVN